MHTDCVTMLYIITYLCYYVNLQSTYMFNLNACLLHGGKLAEMNHRTACAPNEGSYIFLM